MLTASLPYIIVHAMYPYRMPRYCVPFGWAGLVIAVYGAVTFWRWFSGKQKLKTLRIVIQLSALILFVLWAVKIGETLVYAKQQCVPIERIVIISSTVAVAGFFVLRLIRKDKFSMGYLVVPAFLVLAVLSTATTTGFVMGDGQRGANFREIGLWFLENAAEDDKLMTTMPGFMPIYTGIRRGRFIHPENIKPKDAGDFSALIRECRKRGVTLIAWDSRLAASTDDLYYKLWGLDRIALLGAPFYGKKTNQIGPCKLVHIISQGSPKVAIWRIMPEETK